MVHARTRNHGHEEIYGDPGVHGSRYRGVQPCLAYRAEKGQDDSKEVEFGYFAVDKREQTSQPYYRCMQPDICPTSDRVLRRVFPCLQPIAMV
jgi:hypothetical protein